MNILFPGRFQPFHNVHLRILKRLLKKGRVIILIGSSDLLDKENPFTATQRKKMIWAAVKAAGITAKIRFLPHEADDEKWAAHLLRHVPRKLFDAVFTNNPRVIRQLKKHKIPVVRGKMIERGKYSATRVRKLLRRGKLKEVAKLVPDAVASLLIRQCKISIE